MLAVEELVQQVEASAAPLRREARTYCVSALLAAPAGQLPAAPHPSLRLLLGARLQVTFLSCRPFPDRLPLDVPQFHEAAETGWVLLDMVPPPAFPRSCSRSWGPASAFPPPKSVGIQCSGNPCDLPSCHPVDDLPMGSPLRPRVHPPLRRPPFLCPSLPRDPRGCLPNSDLLGYLRDALACSQSFRFAEEKLLP